MARRRRGTWLVASIVLVSLLAVNVALQVGAAGGGDGGARATAYGALTQGAGLAGASASVDGAARRDVEIGNLTDPLGTARSVNVSVGARRSSAGSTATATVEAREVSLFGGRVVVAAIGARARATAGEREARADLLAFTATGVLVDGVPAQVGPGTVLPVPGAGTVAFGEVGAAAPGALTLNLLRVVPEESAAAYAPAAAPLVVGHADLLASAGPGAVLRAAPPPPRERPTPDPDAPLTVPAVPPKAPPLAAPEPEPVPAPGSPRPDGPIRVPPITTPATPPPVVRPAPRLLPGTPGVDGPETVAGARPSVAFPVQGGYSYADDYGAPRAVTGWHQGNDIFAPVGTPVVAVADGVVSKVGWNTLGGNRLWLTDDRGTAYYYAHLSAYAPVAVDGARVRTGDVLAYVGNTGQASTTPPHLHFEIRPGGIDAESVNPYPFLQAWERGNTTAFEASEAVEAAPDAAAGAVVVGVAPDRDAPPPTGDGVASPAR